MPKGPVDISVLMTAALLEAESDKNLLSFNSICITAAIVDVRPDMVSMSSITRYYTFSGHSQDRIATSYQLRHKIFLFLFPSLLAGFGLPDSTYDIHSHADSHANSLENQHLPPTCNGTNETFEFYIPWFVSLTTGTKHAGAALIRAKVDNGFFVNRWR